MPLTLYDACVPVATRTLINLSKLLAKGAAHCEARKIDPQAFLQSRLFPDMFPLTRQVQIACDTAKGGAARLAGLEAPRHEDTETTFDELQARLTKTIDYLKTFEPQQFVGGEERSIVLKLRDRELTLTGQQFLSFHFLPNLFFHTTTAYNLLRHGGVEIGKRDYLGG